VAALRPPGGGLPADPDALAYVVYTSGSTGRPKGVLTTHGGVANYLAFLADEYGIGPADTVLQLATPTFDASIRETLGPLTTGARLVLASAGEAAEPRRVLERVREHGVTAIMAVVPSVLRPILAEAGRTPGAAGPLRLLLASGEPLPVADARRAREVFGAGLRVVNQWGATECTMSSTLHDVAGNEETPVAPVGAPIHNTRVYVLDPELEPAPPGVPGEAYVATPGLARGYGGRPALTAERFVPDPFSAEPGARMYRVGDRVRRRRDGVLEFLGRVDQQVKVQGVRVEPGEVEAALRSHPSVGSAAVVAREERPGEARLVAYVVAADGTGAAPAELRAYLADRLPSYMVPAGWVSLEALPLLPNGKLDRRALPDPDGPGAGAEYAAPRTPTEEILAAIWAEVLGVERVGLGDDFFALGGHSLLATRMTARVREAFGTELPLRTLFEAPTLGGTAERVELLLRRGAASEVPPLVPVRRDGPLPLSFAQQRLWFIHQLAPGSAAYNMPHPLRMRGPLDPGALARALDALAARHESLRTVFAVVDGEPVQVVREAAPVALPTADLSGLPAAAREAETRRLVGEETLRPFDLARGPLLRALLVRAGAEEHALLFTLHHVVADGWSLGVLTREVSALYDAFSRGEEPRLPPLPIQFGDFAAWQRAWLSGEALERQVGWWRERLAGAPPLLEIPTDRPRPAVMDEAGASRPFALSADTSRALLGLSRREGATLFMTLLAGWQALLGRWSGQEDVVVGTPLAGRTRLETEGLIGMFVNTLALRTELGGRPGFRALLGRVRESTLGAYAHQEVPFEKLVEELGVERSLRHTPVFQAMFALHNADPGGLEMGAVEVEPLPRGEETAKFDLHLSLAESGGRLNGVLAYRAGLWEPATAARMAEHLRTLLEGIAADPDRPVAELPLMRGDERAQVLEGWNDTARDYPAGETVCGLLAAQTRRTPGAPALAFRGATLTYAELDRGSGRLASHLRGLGVGPETRVGVCLARTPELVVALLAVLRAGGAYVPLDPAYPRERLGWMLEDAGVSLVLTTTALAGALPEGTPLLALDAARAAVEAEPEIAPECGVLPENLSHVIFTSGSTGRPKGVMIRHSSTVTLLRWLREIVGDEERAATLFSTSINFDVSVAEIFGTLAWGGRLVLVENALELATVQEPVVHASMVPTAAAELLRTGGIPSSVRTLNLGGEALPAGLAQALYELPGVEKVGNLYGPTEDTTYSTYSLVERGGGRVLVGRPAANTRALVLDAELEPVPACVAGELYLAGDGLARGYAGRPDLTAERFLPDPHGPPGSRMYRVMDRVRWTADGELEYLGRSDFQVKVRGFRIEPGEIEAALRSHPAVADAVAVVREDVPGERRIVAYLAAPEGTAAPGTAELRARLRERLPEYMLPAAFVALDALPLTPNGKLDRRALPAPGGPAAGREYVAPRTPAEELLAGVFGEVLHAERVGVHDDFFDLGGHSLLATRVVSRVREVFGVELPLRAMFELPTVAALAPEVESLRPAAALEEWEVDEELARLAELSDEEVQRLLGDT
jgi:amino acid adenylation domain-containing protein